MNDCFFVVENDIIRCLCIKHGKERENAWFWEGSRLGYGPFIFKCHICGEIVFDEAETDIQNTEEQLMDS